MSNLNIDKMNRVAAETIEAGLNARTSGNTEEGNLHFLCALAMATVALSTSIAQLVPMVKKHKVAHSSAPHPAMK